MEKKNMLQNHSFVSHGSYLTLTLGEDDIVITSKHYSTIKELCDYLDCMNTLITLTNGQNQCIEQQGEKIAKLNAENKELNKKLANLETCNKETINEAITYINENTELYKKLDELITEKTELGHKIEAYKDANARLQDQVKELKLEKQCVEDANEFNEQCRQMHMDAIRKDLDEAVAEKKVLAAQIDELQNRIDNQESIIKRVRAVAEREYKQRYDMAGELANLRDYLCDIHDWIETVVDTQKGD